MYIFVGEPSGGGVIAGCVLNMEMASVVICVPANARTKTVTLVSANARIARILAILPFDRSCEVWDNYAYRVQTLHNARICVFHLGLDSDSRLGLESIVGHPCTLYDVLWDGMSSRLLLRALAHLLLTVG